MPLLLPLPKHEGAVSVPVMPVLLYAPDAEHPFDETWIAVEQSLPVAAESSCGIAKRSKKKVIVCNILFIQKKRC